MTLLARHDVVEVAVADARTTGDVAAGDRGAGAHDAERRLARAAAQQVVPQHVDAAEALQRGDARHQRPAKHDLAAERVDVADEIGEVWRVRMGDAPDLPVARRRSGVGAVRVAAVGAVAPSVRVAAVGAVGIAAVGAVGVTAVGAVGVGAVGAVGVAGNRRREPVVGGLFVDVVVGDAHRRTNPELSRKQATGGLEQTFAGMSLVGRGTIQG